MEQVFFPGDYYQDPEFEGMPQTDVATGVKWGTVFHVILMYWDLYFWEDGRIINTPTVYINRLPLAGYPS